MADYRNIPPIFGILISRKLATVYQLENELSYNDALNLLEVIMVDNYNENLINESITK